MEALGNGLLHDSEQLVAETCRRDLSPTIVDKIDGKFVTPLPPKSRMGKWRVLAFARLHPCFAGDGGLLFHFILSKIA